MNTNRTFACVIYVALMVTACNLPATAIPVIPVTGPIGKITPEETLVESGPSNQLIQVTEIKDFYNNSTVRITNGGVAKLDLLDNQISIRLFNDTAVGDITADPSDTTEPVVRLKLVFGGLSGEVTKNHTPAKFELDNGVTIYILGTQFLVLYDPEFRTTYIGNFDGLVAYTIPGKENVQIIQPGELDQISSGFQVQKLILNFTRAEIDTLTIRNRSTLLESLKNYLEPTITPTTTLTPSLTPSPTITLTPTRITPCDKAAFVADVTIPDGTSFSAGSQFTKVWRLRNVGTCTWTNGYSLVFYRGEQMAGQSVNMPSTVAPGQTVDIEVNLVAPTAPGSYRSDWMLRSPSGALFGVGPNGTTSIWVKITVEVSTGTITGIAFSDNNNNSIPDNGEVTQGLTVTLADSSGSTELTSTTTDINGRYTFANLNAGEYIVKWDVNGCPLQAFVSVTVGTTQSQDLATLSSGCACPYVYTEDPVTGEWEFQTTILYKLVDQERAQERYLAQFTGKLLVREEEAEISYLNRLYVFTKMADGSTRILEPDVAELRHKDSGYIILHQGEEILISFRDYPVTGKVTQWWVMAVGYYTPLR